MVHTFAQVEMASDNRSCQTARPSLSFSIDRILNGQFKTERERLKKHHRTVAATQKKIKEMQESNGKMVGNFLQKYEWLQFTRYNPPKLPKSSKRRQKMKRKPGRNPRVPFTPKQLTTLENKFQTMKYLTNCEVTALCNDLNLPEHKIKIWFQNRRAREKRKTTQEDLQEEYIDVMTIGYSNEEM